MDKNYIERVIENNLSNFSKISKKFGKFGEVYYGFSIPIFGCMKLLDIEIHHKFCNELFYDNIDKYERRFMNYTIEIDPKLSGELTIKPSGVATTILRLDNNFRHPPRSTKTDYYIKREFQNFEILDKKLDMISINHNSENIDYLKNMNYNFVTSDRNHIIVENARMLTLHGRVGSKKYNFN